MSNTNTHDVHHDVHRLAAGISAPQRPGPQPLTGYLVQTIAGPMMLPVEVLGRDFLARQRTERNKQDLRRTLTARILAAGHLEDSAIHAALDANDRRTALILALDAALAMLVPADTPVADLRAWIMELQLALTERRVVGAWVIRRHDYYPRRRMGNCFGLLALMTGFAQHHVDDHSVHGGAGEEPPAYRAAYLAWMKQQHPFSRILQSIELRLPLADEKEEMEARGTAETTMLREALDHWLALYTDGDLTDPANYISHAALTAHPDDRFRCAGCGGTYDEDEVSDCYECCKPGGPGGVYCQRLGCWSQHVSAQHPQYGQE